MAYDIELFCGKKICKLKEKDHTRGSSVQIGGSNVARHKMTYNYSRILYDPKVFGRRGIKIIDGRVAKSTTYILERIISVLDNDISDDYWKCTEGNIKEGLNLLLAFAKEHPDGIWRIS